jgi:hypothetical protein
MTKRAVVFLAPLPLAVTVLGPQLLPAGADPRGYGPALVGALAGIGLSAAFGVAGVAFTIVSSLKQAPVSDVRILALGTILAAVPFLWFLIQFVQGRV